MGVPLEYRYFESDGLVYDRMNKKVTINQQEIACTPSELLLLEAFLQNAHIVLTRDILIDLLSHSKAEIQDNTLSVFIMGLRKKNWQRAYWCSQRNWILLGRQCK